ncbi:MAG: competence/damage-inducible protein A [Ruminococcaceae bacterium]|nr:competence/damage-inducible protein A [Oscillospiraceae bacterium]
MNAEIICVGTELLLGNIANTNAVYISNKLSELGIDVFYQTAVGDNSLRLKDTFIHAFERSDIIIITGGLGPTSDDITKEAVAEALRLPLVMDEASKNHIDEYFASTGRIPTESNYKQALAPKGSAIIQNPVGTAPGYCIEKGGKRVFLLPGPPKELTAMFESAVFPYLHGISDSLLVSHYVRIFGIGESKIEEMLGDLVKSSNPTVATYASPGECMIRITAKGTDDTVSEALCKPVVKKIKELFAENIYAIDAEGLDFATVNALNEKKLTIATAESCTGGMVAEKITSVSGSSNVFKTGIIAYSNEIKINELQIPREIIEAYGAISEQTAAHMAVNVRRLHGADLGVGITGVAGPDKSEGKDVGLVFVCLADSERVWVRKLTLTVGYDREKIRNFATMTALDLARRYAYFAPAVMPEGTLQGEKINILYSQPQGDKPVLPENVEETRLPIIDKDDFAASLSTFLAPKEEDKNEATKHRTHSAKEISIIEQIKSNGIVKTAKDITEKIVEGAKAFAADVKTKLKNTPIQTKKIVFNCIFVACIATFVISSINLLSYFISERQQNAIITETQQIWKEALSKNEDGTDLSAVFDPLLKINSDTMAWLTIPNTKINNPVCQTDNNDYYIDHNFNKEKSRYGALFFDHRDIITAEGSSKNLVIYGHNMKDGNMFADLLKYKNLSFYRQNPTFTLTTRFTQSEYRVFSVFLINSKPKDDNGYLYNFLRNNFVDDDSFNEWIKEARKRSLIGTTVNVDEGDEILTLVTCAYDFKDARLVVMARKTREGEGKVNTYEAFINTNPLYPQIWYDTKGITNPFRTQSALTSSDTSSVQFFPYFPLSPQVPASSATSGVSSAVSGVSSANTSTSVSTASSSTTTSTESTVSQSSSSPTSSESSSAVSSESSQASSSEGTSSSAESSESQADDSTQN